MPMKHNYLPWFPSVNLSPIRVDVCLVFGVGLIVDVGLLMEDN